MVRMTWGEITAGITPSFTSDSVMCAVFTAIAMSQQQTRPTPPPMAEPFIRAMVNCGSVAHSKHLREAHRHDLARALRDAVLEGVGVPRNGGADLRPRQLLL